MRTMAYARSAAGPERVDSGSPVVEADRDPSTFSPSFIRNFAVCLTTEVEVLHYAAGTNSATTPALEGFERVLPSGAAKHPGRAEKPALSGGIEPAASCLRKR
jgi:hypothetical protein